MVQPLTVVISDDDATASSSQPSPLSPPKASTQAPARIAVPSKSGASASLVSDDGWSDEEDFYEALRRRKGGKRKSSTAKGKATASRRGRPPKKRKTDAWRDDGSACEAEPEPLDYLPEYYRKRRKSFDTNYNNLREGGLKLPPDYSDVYFSDDERLGELEEKPHFDQITPCHPYKDIVLKTSGGIIPASIAQYLRDYQIQGVEFLHQLFVYQKGGILGDDMGLGKTVQVAAFLTAAFGKTGDCRDAKRMRKWRRTKDDWYPRVLIVCPGTLINNWKNELSRWGWWVVDTYHGAGKDDVLGAARAGRLEVMITTYATYKIGADELNRVPWDAVVADECHQIKDTTSGTTQAMNQVNSLCRIGLTGTAIQNKYEELWTLLNWTNPGRFGTMGDWKHQVCRPLTLGQSHDANYQQLSEARKTAKKLRFHLLPRFFLRRMKTLIAHQLPKKSDKVVFCPLSEHQREAYENLLAGPSVGFVLTAYDKCDCGSKMARGWCCYRVNAEGVSWRALVFPIIVALQKLSNHSSLLLPQDADPPDKQGRQMKLLQEALPATWAELHKSRASLLLLANPEYCGKWKVLRKLLQFWHGNGDKVLVFSHSRRLLQILHLLFNNTKYNVSYLDGTLSYDERQSIVDDFNADPSQFVFLISTKAGGTGLNITSANKVVIMDPHWNPAHDLQAQDRAYRIGQVRDVDVYRLISVGTIEEITYARQIYKQQQANIGYSASNERRYFQGVQQEPDRKGEIFGIRNLLTYNGDQGVLREIVNKTNIAEARAGVRLVDVNMEQAAREAEDGLLIKKEEDDETGGLRQLSALLTGEDNKDGVLQQAATAAAAARAAAANNNNNKARSDPIQAILASEGVEYTHENSEVIGSSKVEDELSRQAELAARPDADPGDLVRLALGPHATVLADADGDEDEDLDGGGGRGDDGAPAYNRHQHPNQHPNHHPNPLPLLHHVFNPPPDVRRRQFCTMARALGFGAGDGDGGAVDFALAVEAMTQAQRRETLDAFYRGRRTAAVRAVDDDHDDHDDGDARTDGEGGGGREGGGGLADPARVKIETEAKADEADDAVDSVSRAEAKEAGKRARISGSVEVKEAGKPSVNAAVPVKLEGDEDSSRRAEKKKTIGNAGAFAASSSSSGGGLARQSIAIWLSDDEETDEL
ncbi:P-loop containing nucleoside triphosphate hydrolase protein [Xylariaceae sp. FL0804]|nr:P-loop containing nucleoside triphosphate hydrolase protein [Xylariaceae sp. FL0804]